MLLIVTIRKEGDKFAFGHICEANSNRVFCGTHIPAPVLETGLLELKNPYVGKVPASCLDCIAEYNNGRREGFREV